jgi:hypothetical protein
VVRSERLERFFRRHPIVGLLTTLLALGTSIVILVVAPDERSSRSGVPMWAVACAGILLFGWATLKYVTLLRGERRDRTPPAR